MDLMEQILQAIKDTEVWFTTKNDPTFVEPGEYYELDEYGELTDKAKEQVIKDVQDLVGDGAVDIDDAIEMWINNCLCECQLDFVDNLKTKFKEKPVIDNIEAFKAKFEENEHSDNNFNFSFKGTAEVVQGNAKAARETLISLFNRFMKSSSNIASMKVDVSNEILTTETKKKVEGYKTRLREENDKSREVLDSIINAEDFDPDSNNGKIMLKAQNIFNKLSDLGYNMEVSVDNGDVEIDILLAQQGGKAIITLNSGNQQIKVFASGNFELTSANVEILDNISKSVESI